MPDALTIAPFCEGWDHAPRWSVLDADFGSGGGFVALLERWKSDPARPANLHVVGLIEQAGATQLHPLLASRCAGLLSGLQRWLWEGGAVTLTLAVGPVSEMLPELQMKADVARAAPPHTAETWTPLRLKAYTRLCRTGAQLGLPGAPAPAAWREVGLIADAGPTAWGSAASDATPPLHWLRLQPAWKRRGHSHETPLPTGHCAVVGAGLSGAAVAHALARRGWRVTVVDQHNAPAQGASGLPVGLVVPQVSVDDNPRSRLSRAGVRLMWEHALALLTPGQDWSGQTDAQGVLELFASRIADHSSGWEQPGDTQLQRETWAQGVGQGDSLWHPRAAWLRPATMVGAWLRHPAIRFQGACSVVHLRREASHWWLHCADEPRHLGPFDTVVLCNALGLSSLVRSTRARAEIALQPSALALLEGLHAVHGTLSYGQQPAGVQWPRHAVNGHGSFIANLTREMLPTPPDTPVMEDTRWWFSGSTFELDPQGLQDLAGQHAANAAKLRRLLPAVAGDLPAAFQGALHWQSSRCVATDRMPLVGALHADDGPGLWVCAAMGARGLSLSALCAEWLVAQMHSEPWPLERSLARHLSVLRRPSHRSFK